VDNDLCHVRSDKASVRSSPASVPRTRSLLLVGRGFPPSLVVEAERILERWTEDFSILFGEFMHGYQARN
jgi:hypothetical protein